MRRQASRGFTLVELLIVIGVIVTLMSIVVSQFSGANKSVQDLQCRKQLKEFYTGLEAYKAGNNGNYPSRNGKEFITILYHDKLVDDIKLLKCPGPGAKGDKVPDVKDLIFSSLGGNNQEGPDNLNSKFRKNTDWKDGTISYWAASGNDDNPDVSDKRWTLRNMLSPKPTDEQDMIERKETPGVPSTPLVGDDHAAPQNHKDYYFIVFANGKVRKIKSEWKDNDWPFASLTSGGGG